MIGALVDEVLVRVQGVPMSRANARGHWSRWEADRKAWIRDIRYAAHSARNGARWRLPDRSRGPEAERRGIAIVQYRLRLLDPVDNLPASCKWVMDGLIGALIVDDGPAWVEVLAPPRQLKIRTAFEQRVEVRVRLLA